MAALGSFGVTPGKIGRTARPGVDAGVVAFLELMHTEHADRSPKHLAWSPYSVKGKCRLVPPTKEIAGRRPWPFLRLDRGDQAGRSPGAGGVPEADAERPALGDLQPAGLQLPGVRAHVADVGDRQLAALPEHPGRLAQRP